MANGRHDSLITLTDPQSPIAEAYRGLRTNLEFSSLDHPLKTLLVTSAAPEEGKSTILANLAVTTAQAGKQVILVDCDLRRPSLHQIFDLTSGLGLTSMVVDDEAMAAPPLQETGVPGLQLLPGGPLPPNPSDLLGSRRMQDIITLLADRADMVLFDAPPVIAVTDAVVLASRVDGVLLVISVGKTKREHVQRARDLLDKVNARVIGAVLNNVELDMSLRRYYAVGPARDLSPLKMIDLHTHILPGMDDGAKSLEESIAMAQIAHADGVRVMAATPHNFGYTDPNLRSQIYELTAAVQNALTTHGVDVRIVPGVEAYLVPDLVQQLNEGLAIPLDTSHYVLVEWGFNFTPLYTEQVLFELQVHGFQPVLAHPARYHDVQDNPNFLYALAEKGILCQLTAASLTGGWGNRAQETALTLLEHNMAHIIASDAHSPDWRPPRLSEAVQEASQVVGEERARAMVTTVPRDILDDREVVFEPPVHVKPRRRWFWR